MQRGKERCFRTLLVNGAAPDHDFAESGFVHQSGFERRRRPLSGIGLLHVVHVVKAQRFRGARIQSGEDSRLAVGGDFCSLLKARFAQHTHHHVAAFVHAAILGGDGWLADPVLQALDGFVVAFFDFRPDGVEIAGGCCAVRPGGPGESGCAGRNRGGALQESAAVGGRQKRRGIEMVLLARVLKRFMIGVRKIWHGSLRNRFSHRDKKLGIVVSFSTLEIIPSLF